MMFGRRIEIVCVIAHCASKLPTQIEIVVLHGNVVAMPMHTRHILSASLTVFFFQFAGRLVYMLIYLYTDEESERETSITKMKWTRVSSAQYMQFHAISILITSFQIQWAREKKKSNDCICLSYISL